MKILSFFIIAAVLFLSGLPSVLSERGSPTKAAPAIIAQIQSSSIEKEESKVFAQAGETAESLIAAQHDQAIAGAGTNGSMTASLSNPVGLTKKPERTSEPEIRFITPPFVAFAGFAELPRGRI